MAKIEEFVWKCLRLLLGSKNTIKFSVNTSPYFHSALLVMWTVTVLCCNEAILASYPFLGLLLLREGQVCILYFRTPGPKSEKSKLKMTGRPQIQRRIQAHTVSFQFTSKSILPMKPTLSRSLLPNFQFRRF